MLKITISQIFAYNPLVTMMGFKNKFLLTYPLLTTCMTLTWHIGVGCIPMCYISKEAVTTLITVTGIKEGQPGDNR